MFGKYIYLCDKLELFKIRICKKIRYGNKIL